MREKLKRVFVAQSVPAWVTVLFVVGGAIGTYYVSPMLNQRLEAQRIKTDFVMRNLDSLSTRTRMLLAITSVIHQKMIHGKTISDADFDRAYSVLAELQWDVISLSIIFADDETRKLIADFQQASFKAQVSIQQLQSSVPTDPAGIDAAVKRDGAITQEILTLALSLSLRIAKLGSVETPQPDFH